MANWRGRGDFFLEGRNDFPGDQVRSVWSVWITFMKEILCFVRRTTSIQTADLNFFKKFENDTDTFGSWVFLFIFILHAPRVCPTANVTTTSRTSPVATETAKNGWNLQDSEIMEVEFGSVALRLQYSAKWEGRSAGTELPMGMAWEEHTERSEWMARQCRQKIEARVLYTSALFWLCTIQSFGNIKLEFNHGMFTHVVSPNNYYSRKHSQKKPLVSSIYYTYLCSIYMWHIEMHLGKWRVW